MSNYTLCNLHKILQVVQNYLRFFPSRVWGKVQKYRLRPAKPQSGKCLICFIINMCVVPLKLMTMWFYVSETTHVLEVNWCLRSLFNRKHSSQSLQKPLDPKPVRNSIEGTTQHAYKYIYIYIKTHSLNQCMLEIDRRSTSSAAAFREKYGGKFFSITSSPKFSPPQNLMWLTTCLLWARYTWTGDKALYLISTDSSTMIYFNRAIIWTT